MVKYLSANSGAARDASSIPRLGRSPGGGDGNPLQYSCLGNPLDRGAWRATVHGLKESDTTTDTHTHRAPLEVEELRGHVALASTHSTSNHPWGTSQPHLVQNLPTALFWHPSLGWKTSALGFSYSRKPLGNAPVNLSSVSWGKRPSPEAWLSSSVACVSWQKSVSFRFLTFLTGCLGRWT